MGGGVIKCKDSIGNTYRVLEYRSTSSSESNSWYTSAVNSNGMYDTTVLTRASTSGESYLTRSSTSGTSYLTQIVSSNWYFKYIQPQNNRDANTYISYFGSNFSASYIQGQGISNKNIGVYGYAYNLYRAGSYTITRIERTGSTYSPWSTSTYVTTYTINGGNPLYYINREFDLNTNFTGYKNVQATSGWLSSVNYTYYNTLSYDAVVSTTNTSYLTRSSTSATQYLTRSSTSGYSGKSSSSKSIEISSWL